MEFSEIKLGSSTDYLDILELNKTLVDEWMSYDSKREHKDEKNWEELSADDRFMQGGPWLDPTTLKIHCDEFLKFGNIISMRDTRGKLIGELEYHIINNCAHLDWMMINPELHSKGKGSELLKYFILLMKNQNVEKIETEPEEGIEHFYRKNDFTEVMPLVTTYHRLGDDIDNKIYRFTNGSGNPKNIFTGDVVNTSTYTRFLLGTTELYGKVFGYDKVPVRYTEVEYNDYKIQVIVRDLIPMVNNSLVIIAHNPEIKLDKIDTERIVNVVIDEMGSTNRYVLSTLGAIPNTEWDIFRIFPKMEYLL